MSYHELREKEEKTNNFPVVIDHLITNEGGYVNHPMDPGGATIYGVTKKNWESYTGRKWSKSEFKRLTPRDVKRFYEARYWDSCSCDSLPSGVDYCVFDFAVNSGVSRSSKYLQRIVGSVQDGVIGEKTLQAVFSYIDSYETKKQGCIALIDKIIADRKLFLSRLKTFAVFGRGWNNRIKSVRIKAYELVKEPFNDTQSDIEISRTNKTASNTIITTLGTGGVVASQVDLTSIDQVARDLSNVNTLAQGVRELLGYGIYLGLGIIICYALYQIYIRYQDWFLEKR